MTVEQLRKVMDYLEGEITQCEYQMAEGVGLSLGPANKPFTDLADRYKCLTDFMQFLLDTHIIPA